MKPMTGYINRLDSYLTHTLTSLWKSWTIGHILFSMLFYYSLNKKKNNNFWFSFPIESVYARNFASHFDSYFEAIPIIHINMRNCLYIFLICVFFSPFIMIVKNYDVNEWIGQKWIILKNKKKTKNMITTTITSLVLDLNCKQKINSKYSIDIRFGFIACFFTLWLWLCAWWKALVCVDREETKLIRWCYFAVFRLVSRVRFIYWK